MKTVNIAVLSAWHVHAEEYARTLQHQPGIRVCCLWDDDPARGRQMAALLNIPFEENLLRVLRDPGVDGVQVTTQTSLHTKLMVEAARAGKHIFTEKVLAITPGEAEEAARAVKESGIRFAISFPHLFRPALMKARDILSSGQLGALGYARVRNAHDGATAGWLPERFYDPDACGGGAMMDLGAHPMYTLLWLLGEPDEVRSTFTKVTGKAVEDNAVSLLRYPDGAIAVSETSFISSHHPYTLELSGSLGTLLVQEDRLYLATEATQGKLQEVKDLPAAPPPPLVQWAQTLTGEKPWDMTDFGIDAAVRLTRLMDMAYQGQ